MLANGPNYQVMEVVFSESFWFTYMKNQNQEVSLEERCKRIRGDSGTVGLLFTHNWKVLGSIPTISLD